MRACEPCKRGEDMILFIVEAVLGVVLLFLAVFLWSVSRRLSAAVLSITAVFFYSSLAVKLLEYYKVLVMRSALSIIVQHALLLLALCSFIITLVVFIREEEKRE